MNNSILKDLEKNRLALFDDLSSLTQAQLSYSKKGWSIDEILYHIWLAEESSEKYIRTKTKFPETILKIKPSTYLRMFLVKLLLPLGLKVKAPKTTQLFPKEIDLKELNNKWTESRQSFDSLIIELKEKKLNNKAVFRHPLIGRINIKLTLAFFEFHFRHHQKQINNLKRQF
ncbi:MAG: DinB family protein [Flavobacteriales bacterium]|jgi:hypothetical protein|tara:strand:+ start:2447 stop:2962 length:516 start_codon:yes stop_codon:yes gene_type:complete